MLKKSSQSTLAGSLSTTVAPVVESTTLVTYTTTDAHNLFPGALINITGVADVGGVSVNLSNRPVIRIDSPTKFTVAPATALASIQTYAAPSNGMFTSYNGALYAANVLYAQPVVPIRPTYYNYVVPTVTVTNYGADLKISYSAAGLSNPSVSYAVYRTSSASSTPVYLAKNSVTASISSISGSGSLVTATTSAAHGFITGQTVTVTSTNYNFSGLIASTPSNTVFTVSATNTGATSTGSATATSPATASNILDTLGSGTTLYYYTVAATNSSGTVTASSTKQTYFIGAPSTPTLTDNDNQSITVRWTAPTSTSTPTYSSIIIDRATNSGFSANLVSTTAASISSTSYVDTTITANGSTTYYYRVRYTYTTTDGSGVTITGTNSSTSSITPAIPTQYATLTTDSDYIYYGTPVTLTATVNTLGSGSYQQVTFQASNDNSTWTTLSTATASTAVSQGKASASTTFTMDVYGVPYVSNVYKYFRATTVSNSLYSPITASHTVSALQNYLYVNTTSTLSNFQRVNSGTANTVTLTVTDELGNLVDSASVQWYQATYGNTSFQTYGSSATTNSSGVATKSVGGASRTTSYAIAHVVSKTGYATADSRYDYLSDPGETLAGIAQYRDSQGAHVVLVNESLGTSEYFNYGYSFAHVAGSGGGAGTLRGSNPDGNLYHGYYDTSWDMQSSALWDTTVTWDKFTFGAARISSLAITLHRDSVNGTATAYAGFVLDSGVTNNWNNFSSTYDYSIMRSLGATTDGQTVTNTLTSSAVFTRLMFYGEDLAYNYLGKPNGVVLGPPTSTSNSYYCWFYGVSAGTSLAPKLAVSYAANPTAKF